MKITWIFLRFFIQLSRSSNLSSSDTALPSRETADLEFSVQRPRLSSMNCNMERVAVVRERLACLRTALILLLKLRIHHQSQQQKLTVILPPCALAILPHVREQRLLLLR